VHLAHERRRLLGAERGVLDVELVGLLPHPLALAAGGEADDLKPAGIGADHVKRLLPDRTGGAENDDAPHR